MTLSEAIRLGALLRPQAFGEYFDRGGTCAIGAACEAAGVKPDEISDYERRFTHIFEHVCPACGLSPDTNGRYLTMFNNTVTHLNDTHRWTREAIADWVATIEPVEAPSVVPAVHEVIA